MTIAGLNEPGPPGLLRAGAVVVLSGPAAAAALQALKIAIRARRANGAPQSAVYAALAVALTDAVAVDGHADDHEPTPLLLSIERPTVPITEAAARLQLSRRQTRRYVKQLGGRKIGGCWLLDEESVREMETRND
jgi:hypothetical protein